MDITNIILLVIIVLLVVVVLVSMFFSFRYRERRCNILYRLALGKTAMEGPADDPIPEEDLVQEEENAAATEAEASNAESKPSGGKRIDLEEAREKLWERIEAYMKEKMPFTDPDFDRNVLAKDMYSNISYVSGAINAHGRSFTTWVAEYRVKMAIELMQKSPKIPVRELSVKVGVLNPVVFNRQFRGVTGMSVSEFRSQIEKAAQ